MDANLSLLHRAPMLVDLEGPLAMSRRTLTRQVRVLQRRYALPGGESWRHLRDHYRLVVASVLLSHVEATPRAVAGIVGYGSVEALDHAFRRAALPTPITFRRTLLAV